MTRRPSRPLSARLGNKPTAQPPRTAVGLAALMLLPVAVILAVSFPVAAVAAVGGAVLAKLHRRLRTARTDAEARSVGLRREVRHDV